MRDTRVHNIEWLNYNANRYYPFTKPNLTFSGVELYNDVILDVNLTTGLSLLELSLSEFNVNSTDIEFEFKFNDTNIIVLVPLLAEWPYYTSVEYNDITLNLVFGAGCTKYAEGKYVADTLANIDNSRLASYSNYNVNSVRSDRNNFQLKGSINVDNGINCYAKVSLGKLTLIAGPGFGSGYNCGDSRSRCSDRVTMFGGYRVGSSGNANIVGGPGVSVKTEKDGAGDVVIVISGTKQLSNVVNCNG